MQPPFLTLTLTLTLEKCRQSIELRNEYRSLGIDLPGNYKMMRMIGSKMQWRGSGRWRQKMLVLATQFEAYDILQRKIYTKKWKGDQVCRELRGNGRDEWVSDGIITIKENIIQKQKARDRGFKSRHRTTPDTRHLANTILINPPFELTITYPGRQWSWEPLSILPSFVIHQADPVGEEVPNLAFPADQLQLFVA